ncbi:MAG TPA: ATP-binding cassette domain-containing protein [Chitinophagaceae bacterium]|nr:ATP-binding cassette domain-containing protein [Chitinophagaceae bacterium]
MTISLSDAGKRFNRDWIFRHFSYTFQSGQSYAITGPNGSGKSTLLQVLSGSMMLNEGACRWQLSEKEITSEKIYDHISICAPYLEVVEEMTLKEFLEFHQKFKAFIPGISIEEIIKMTGLEKAVNKQIRFYSSGMKQRVKLAQCIFSDTAIVLLDEPCTNLDAAGIELYHSIIKEYCRDRLVIVSSNDEVEYGFCTKVININDYKK